MARQKLHEAPPFPPRAHDPQFIHAALGILSLSVAALYMAVALPHFAPSAIARFIDLRSDGRPAAVPVVPAPVTTVPAPGGAAAARLEKPAGIMTVGSTSKLADLFEDMGYDLETIRGDRNPVPRVFLANLPSDLESVPSIDVRKELFIRTMLPLVLQVNETILLERGQLLALRARLHAGRAPSRAETAWLDDLAERYGLAEPDVAQLLKRVDIIPPSLALAQAAEESGWGTSRFAREGNAAFGQYTFSEELGLVPEAREDGKRHLVRSYSHLLDAVRSYARNLNSHEAYDQFRRLRAAMRAQGQELDSLRLAATLSGYSARGGEYVETIRNIVRANNLQPLDRARLGGGPIATLLAAGR